MATQQHNFTTPPTTTKNWCPHSTSFFSGIGTMVSPPFYTHLGSPDAVLSMQHHFSIPHSPNTKQKIKTNRNFKPHKIKPPHHHIIFTFGFHGNKTSFHHEHQRKYHHTTYRYHRAIQQWYSLINPHLYIIIIIITVNPIIHHNATNLAAIN